MPERLLATDPHRALWMTDPDLCCRIRKTEPLAARSARLRRLVHRPQALPERGARRLAPVRGGRRAHQDQPAGELGRRRAEGLYASGTTCRRIRWSRAAIPRSAACPAPAAWRRARTRAPAAGAASTRPNAAFTPASKPTAAGSEHMPLWKNGRFIETTGRSLRTESRCPTAARRSSASSAGAKSATRLASATRRSAF